MRIRVVGISKMKVFQGEQKLKQWAESKSVNLSQAGADWLVAALDPYHDTKLQHLTGWPDVSTASSVVSCIRQSIQISQTSGGADPTSENWDCHIALSPDLFLSDCCNTTSRKENCGTINSANIDSQFGGLIARGVFNSGSPLDWTQPPANSNLGTLQLTAAYGSGLSRIIGLGFEVYNTTADLYRQGSVVYYRQPEPKKIPDSWRFFHSNSGVGEVIETFMTGVPLRLPPTSPAEAMLLSGSVERKASDGAYIVAAFHSNENEPQPVGYTNPIWCPSQTSDTYQQDPSPNNGTVMIPRPQVGSAQQLVRGGITFNNYSPQAKKLFPFHMCGCIFSGLSPQTTLTMNMVVYVENFPNANDPLSVLATPSARYDPIALEMYSKALCRLPVGVPVRENGLGQWFSDVIREMEPYIVPLASAFHPAAGAVVKGITTANNIYRATNQPPPGPSMQTKTIKNKKKKTKKKNSALAAGNRGKKGNIQGPMRS